MPWFFFRYDLKSHTYNIASSSRFFPFRSDFLAFSLLFHNSNLMKQLFHLCLLDMRLVTISYPTRALVVIVKYHDHDSFHCNINFLQHKQIKKKKQKKNNPSNCSESCNLTTNWWPRQQEEVTSFYYYFFFNYYSEYFPTPFRVEESL